MALYSRYKLSFAAYLSMPALISGLHKMLQTLVLSFFLTLDLDVRGVLIFIARSQYSLTNNYSRES